MRILNRPDLRYDDDRSIFKRNPSKLLLYTNPKLTTNVKILVDSNDKIYLESFNANRELSSSNYKNFKVDASSSYSIDVSAFWSKNVTPANIAYFNHVEGSVLSTKQNFDNQFDGFYTAGVDYLNSPYYSEKFSYLAPLKLGDVLPDYFVIFKIKDPASYSLVKTQLSNITVEDVRSGLNFKDNILDKLDIIKTFDLKNSNIGRYLENYFLDINRPVSPLFTSFRKNSFTKFRGIDYSRGGYIEKSEYFDDIYVKNDMSIIEFEYLVTQGFERNSVIDSSILNLEFLFDDNTDEWTASRYIGLYVSCVKESSLLFRLEDYNLQNNEKIQSIDKKGSKIVNKNGVNLFFHESKDITGIPSFNQIVEQNSIFYLKDKLNNFYSVNRKNPARSGSFIRLSSREIDYDNFTSISRNSISLQKINDVNKSRAHLFITDVDRFVIGDKLIFRNDNNLDFEFTVSCSDLASVGNNFSNHFSPKGSKIDICNSLVKAINFDSQSSNIFNAVRYGDSVIVYSKFNGSLFNQLNIEIIKVNDEFPIIIGNFINDKFYFQGGVADNFKSFLINGLDSNFSIEAGDYIKTLKGFSKIYSVSSYLEESTLTISPYLLVSVLTSDEIFFNSTGFAQVYKNFYSEFGRFNIFPLSVIDTDFYSEEYSRMGELDIERSFYSESVDNVYVDQSSYPNIREFYSNGGFNRLYPLSQNEDSSLMIVSEYDRLLENYVNDLSTVSRISPYIAKWVAANSAKDVRDNPYRLNISDSFSILNFSPDINTTERNSNYFTHEWYYIINAPDYFKNNADSTWSYLNYDGVNILNDLKSVENDNFIKIFRNNYLDFDYEKEEKSVDINYSLFRNGSSANYPYTFFRGSKVVIKEKENESLINYNIDSIRFKTTDKYNGYRFSSAILNSSTTERGIHVIVNDKFRFVVIILVIDISEEFLLQDGKIDRTLLYSLNHSIEFEDVNIGGDIYKIPLKIGNDLVYKDVVLKGAIDPSNSSFDVASGVFTIIGMPDINGISTEFDKEIKLGSNGKLNSIRLQITEGSNLGTYIFSDIIKVFSSNKFTCRSVTRDNSPITMPIISANIELDFLQGSYSIIGGGFNFYNSILDEYSYGTICKKFNLGDPSIKYIRVNSNGNITLNDYVLEFNQLDNFIKPSYLTIVSDENKPSLFSSIDVIGYNLAIRPDFTIYPYYRYTGSYDIKTNDIVSFTDTYFDYTDINSYQYKVYRLTSMLNCNFKIDSDLGIIKNLWFFKTNDSQNSNILQLDSSSGYKSIYPLIGEVSIDKNNFNTFQSQWDPYFYLNYIDKKNFEYAPGTYSSKVENMFMSPVILNLPNTLVDISVMSEDVNISSSEFSTVLTANIKNSIVFYLKNRLMDYFKLWINPEFADSFNNSLDFFLVSYIEKNILNVYRIEELFFYSRISQTDEYIENWKELDRDRSFRSRFIDIHNLELINNKINGQNFKYSIKINLTRI